MLMGIAASFSKVTKTYSSGEAKTPVLKDLDFSIGSEEMAAFAGPSGSGKTTILNLLGCIDNPDSGIIKIDGLDVTSMSQGKLAELRNSKIGFIFQSFNLVPVLTAFENAEFPLLLGGMKDRDERREKVMNILKLVGIEELSSRFPGQLSGGQQQRVAIARALVKNPLLILADEPTANLDSKSASETLELMRMMNSELKTTFVFSTHDIKIMDFAKRLIRLVDGNIVSDETK
jgi:putative ABC transport system ATP-binding protein